MILKTHIYNNVKQWMTVVAICLMSVVSLSSCSETDDTVDEFADWQNRNDTFFNSIYSQASSSITSGSSEWKILRKWSLNENMATKEEDHVVARVINEGTGSGCPLYTDSVYVHYSLRYMPSASYPEGKLIEQTWTGDYNLKTMVPKKLGVGLIDGWATALQYMHVGDRWIVYVPYALAYGVNDYTASSSSGTLKGGSTLVYDITLVAYYHPGKVVPAWRAKERD